MRNMLGYTGTWRGQRVSVMGSGMGIPSACLYADELCRVYGVRRLVRIGTCDAVAPTLALGDLVLAQGACTDSNVNRLRFRGYDYAPLASWPLLRAVTAGASGRGDLPPLDFGNVSSSDFFVHPDPELVPLLARHGVLALDMETAGLYATAAEHGAEALSALTVSDRLGHGEQMTPLERPTGVDRMVRLVLDALTARGPERALLSAGWSPAADRRPAPPAGLRRATADEHHKWLIELRTSVPAAGVRRCRN